MREIIDSFKTGGSGLSGRKLTAFTITGMVVILHCCYFYSLIKNWNPVIFVEVLIVDFVAIGFFMGMVTVQNIIELKNGGISKSTTTSTTETVETKPT